MSDLAWLEALDIGAIRSIESKADVRALIRHCVTVHALLIEDMRNLRVQQAGIPNHRYSLLTHSAVKPSTDMKKHGGVVKKRFLRWRFGGGKHVTWEVVFEDIAKYHTPAVRDRYVELQQQAIRLNYLERLVRLFIDIAIEYENDLDTNAVSRGVTLRTSQGRGRTAKSMGLDS